MAWGGGKLDIRAAPLYIQEKVHPKALIDDLLRETRERKHDKGEVTPDLFADFNGIPHGVDKTEFYQHEQNWSNRLILGDSLQVMAGLAEREGLRGQVQCIYFDPPYGIKFNSNFQWSTTSRDVKDNKADHITREPEQVKAFRDTWRDGIHSYLSYIRDRLIVARDLLTESGSIFVQIGDENVHRVRAVMDEVFGDENYVSCILYRTTGGFTTKGLSRIGDDVLWYAKDISVAKFRPLLATKNYSEDQNYRMLEDEKFSSAPMSSEQQMGLSPIPKNGRVWRYDNATGQGAADGDAPIELNGTKFVLPKNTHWKANYPLGMERLKRAGRLLGGGKTLSYKRYFDDYAAKPLNATWLDTGVSGFASDKTYVVQTLPEVIARCVLMSTDPGDLVLDPTCGSGTTAYVAEQWGRRWITIDTSRVALALARARLMGARYPHYLLADSSEGQMKEAEIRGVGAAFSRPFSTPLCGRQNAAPTGDLGENPGIGTGFKPTYGNISHGFVYERVPHITLKSIANNAEIDVIWEKFQERLEPLREQLNAALGRVPLPPRGGGWQEWEIPREADEKWPEEAKRLHAGWWRERIARQKEIDASIAAKADTEFLYDKPYVDNKKVRVAGPFTVESLSPHRMLMVDENDEIIDPLERVVRDGGKDFASMILEELRTAGVQQANKEDKIVFTSLQPWPGRFINGEGVYEESEKERRAAIFIGPEFASVTRHDLVAAAREAADSGFDVLIACAFNFDAASADLPSLGRIPILKARMNADLHMSTELKNTGKGNLFIIFGEPDIAIEEIGKNQIQVSIKGVDVFDPAKGEVRSDEPDKIACWFIDTDYNEESFFVRHAYFLGANDPYKSLQTSLKAEIDRDAWESLNSAISRPFDKPKSGRIAVKVINHLGDEVMKVYRVS